MTRENREIKLDELLNELEGLREQNSKLADELLYFKSISFSMVKRCKALVSENRELKSEIADLRFTHNYLTSEEAGRAFARELLGKPMTHEEISIEAAENCHVPYSGDDF